jgi:DNA-binding GntR family transcriptional regulator
MPDAKIVEDVSESICESISLAIAEGALRPGMKVHEDVIARHFGVSRTVARGALAILERERVLERRRNHGCFVATPDKIQAGHLLEARRAIELAIVARAAQTVSSDALDGLLAATHDEDAVHSGDDAAAKNRISGNFHLELALAAGNTVLFEALKTIIARLALVSALYERETSNRCGAHDHREILEAIRQKDDARAVRLMEDHLQELENRMDLSAPPDEQHSLSAVLERFAPMSATSQRARRNGSGKAQTQPLT